MKVSDLRDLLTDLPDDLLVVVDGYEGGLTEDIDVRVVSIALNVHPEGYYGEHEIPGGNVDYAIQDAGPGVTWADALYFERHPDRGDG